MKSFRGSILALYQILTESNTLLLRVGIILNIPFF